MKRFKNVILVIMISYWQELADHIPMDCGDYKKTKQ